MKEAIALCRFCLLLVVWSIIELHRRILQIFVAIFLMGSTSCLKFQNQTNDFGCGFLVFGFCSQVWGLFGLFLMFGFGLKLLQPCSFLSKGPNLMQLLRHYREKTIDLGYEFSSKHHLFEARDQKIVSCKCNVLNFPENSNSSPRKEVQDSDRDENDNHNHNEEEEHQCHFNEDEEFSVMELRKQVKMERNRANRARAELEKERMAAASAAEEAMALILRLQREKSYVEMEANQYRRMVEHKLEYDNELIQSLQWIVAKHESERSLLEHELKLCRGKLNLFMKGNNAIIDRLSEVVCMSSTVEEDNPTEDMD